MPLSICSSFGAPDQQGQLPAAALHVLALPDSCGVPSVEALPFAHVRAGLDRSNVYLLSQDGDAQAIQRLRRSTSQTVRSSFLNYS